MKSVRLGTELPRKSLSPFSRDSPPFSVIHVFFPVLRNTQLIA